MWKQQTLVSVVIINWNKLDETLDCIASVQKQTYRNLEIIVVDNGSSKDEKNQLAKLKNIIYVDNAVNRGFTGGHIDGLKHANGEFIALLNNDAVLKEDYIERALLNFKDEQVAAVGGRAYFWNNEAPLFDETNPFYSFMEIDLFSGEARMLSADYNVTQEVNVVSGSAVVVRRSVIDQIGYLYDGFFAYFEETDLFARMKRAGYKVLYDPTLRIWHKNGATSGASTGSYFFYYQIFRNRFIFTIRNFEPWFLRRFLYIYFKIVLVSLLQLFRDPSHRVMHKAYLQAGIFNMLHLPRTLSQRRQLQRQLGKSHYNHRIHAEQTGVSIIIDGTKLDAKTLKKTFKDIQKVDTNPLHEYLIVINDKKNENLSSDLDGNARFIVNRGYFSTHPVNLGCLAARFSWLFITDTTNFDLSILDQIVTQTLGTQTKVIAFGSPTKGRAPYAAIRKDFFEGIGGFGADTKLQKNLTKLLHYGHLVHSLAWFSTSTKALSILYTGPVDKQIHYIRQQIRFNTCLDQLNHGHWFDRLRNKYYRLYQITTFVQWVFVREVSLYLKIARIKNLVLSAFTLRTPRLAIEFKHIRNEVLLHTGQYAVVSTQQQVIKNRLQQAMVDPTQIPVFIVCFERVNSLKKLVQWLENHGIKKIIFIDNDSTYPPLLSYYANTPYQVLRLYRNVGHTSPWSAGIVRSLVPDDFYIVTDPDVLPTEACPRDFLTHFLEIHKTFLSYQKVGFGLKIDDLPDTYPLKKAVIEWESQFWKNELTPKIYEAGVDTTFALYKPYTYHYTLHPSIRTGEPYTARHLPWYVDPKKIESEERYYRYRANHNISSWNADTIKDRYAKEMGKQL